MGSASANQHGFVRSWKGLVDACDPLRLSSQGRRGSGRAFRCAATYLPERVEWGDPQVQPGALRGSKVAGRRGVKG